jgi:plastocyanin
MTTMRISAKLAVLGTAAALCAAAGGVTVARAARTTTVTLKDISFKKAVVHVAKGDKVLWVWKDKPSPHNVTFARQHSGTKQTGTYTMTFRKAGTFNYRCTLHPGMEGKVVVR